MSDNNAENELKKQKLKNDAFTGMIIVVAILGTIILGIALTGGEEEPSHTITTGGESTPPPGITLGDDLPILLELGRDSCPACVQMIPELEALTSEYEGKLVVQKVNTSEDPQIGRQYGIRYVPTQILFDPEGNELFRHTGYWARAEIIAKFAELGYNLNE